MRKWCPLCDLVATARFFLRLKYPAKDAISIRAVLPIPYSLTNFRAIALNPVGFCLWNRLSRMAVTAGSGFSCHCWRFVSDFLSLLSSFCVFFLRFTGFLLLLLLLLLHHSICGISCKWWTCWALSSHCVKLWLLLLWVNGTHLNAVRFMTFNDLNDSLTFYSGKNCWDL